MTFNTTLQYLAKACNGLKTTKLSHAWNKLLKGSEVEVDFSVFGPEYFTAAVHRGGEPEATLENIIEQLETDAEAQGYHHQTEEGIATSVVQEVEVAAASPTNSDEADLPVSMILSQLHFCLDKALGGLV